MAQGRAGAGVVHAPQRAVTQQSAETATTGQVLAGGPVEEEGRRYCMNSAALRFVPYEDL
ncbi:MAG TPA: peptide-methionine (R)-S-oxide reductase [Actinomycetota bacterium]|nr:peptide-methionine (R)-S-oxide reductase [Actinomycetota bacterium]